MPKLSSYSHSSSESFENLGFADDDIGKNTQQMQDIYAKEKKEIINEAAPKIALHSTNNLRNKAVKKMRSILGQVLSVKNLEQSKGLSHLTAEEKARENLTRLIHLALSHSEYLKTETVLRLVTNEVEKQLMIDDMELFFNKATISPPKVNLITVLIKHQLKSALTQEQKNEILITLGLKLEELTKQNLSEARFHEISQELEQLVPKADALPAALKDAILFSKEVAKYQSFNKMPPSSISASLVASLLPVLKKTAEYSLTLLRFEMQVTTLLKLALKKWIESEAP